MRRVVWTDEAVANLEAIQSYIEMFNAPAAARLAERLIATAESLRVSADRGRPIRAGLREVVVIYPYLIRYRATEDTVFITRIRHGARRG